MFPWRHPKIDLPVWMHRLSWVFAGHTSFCRFGCFQAHFRYCPSLCSKIYTNEPHHEKTCLQGLWQLRLKPACSADETAIIPSRQQTTKALIRLRGCSDWSAPLLFAYGINRFSHGSNALDFSYLYCHYIEMCTKCVHIAVNAFF